MAAWGALAPHAAPLRGRSPHERRRAHHESHEAAALSAASGGGVGAGGVSVVGVGNVGGVGGGGASMRATEAPASGAGQRVVHFLQATFSDPMPWELQPPWSAFATSSSPRS